jgi:hypothetical protein
MLAIGLAPVANVEDNQEVLHVITPKEHAPIADPESPFLEIRATDAPKVPLAGVREAR